MKSVIDASPRTITAIRHAFEIQAPGRPRADAALLMRRALADGWLTPLEIEGYMLATDPRLYRLTTRELLKALAIPTQPVFERPTRGARDAEGIERVSALDFARLLILLERLGLEIDAGPICEALALSIGARRLLTADELTVYWRAQARSDAPLILADPRAQMGGGPDAPFATSTGYMVQTVWQCEDDGADGLANGTAAATMLTINPPKHKRLRAGLSARPGARPVRKLLGEARA